MNEKFEFDLNFLDFFKFCLDFFRFFKFCFNFISIIFNLNEKIEFILNFLDLKKKFRLFLDFFKFYLNFISIIFNLNEKFEFDLNFLKLICRFLWPFWPWSWWTGWAVRCCCWCRKSSWSSPWRHLAPSFTWKTTNRTLSTPLVGCRSCRSCCLSPLSPSAWDQCPGSWPAKSFRRRSKVRLHPSQLSSTGCWHLSSRKRSSISRKVWRTPAHFGSLAQSAC